MYSPDRFPLALFVGGHGLRGKGGGEKVESQPCPRGGSQDSMARIFFESYL